MKAIGLQQFFIQAPFQLVGFPVFLLICVPFSCAQSTTTEGIIPLLTVSHFVIILAVLAAAAALVMAFTAACEMRTGPCCGIRSSICASCFGLWPLPKAPVVPFRRTASGRNIAILQGNRGNEQTHFPVNQVTPRTLQKRDSRGSASVHFFNPLKEQAIANTARGAISTAHPSGVPNTPSSVAPSSLGAASYSSVAFQSHHASSAPHHS